MSDKQPSIIVTGDHARDRFIYVEGMGDEPANLREAWVTAKRFWIAELAGSSGSLIEYLKTSGINAYNPFVSREEIPESIFFVTRQGEGENRRWRGAQALTAGERQYPSGRISSDIPGISAQMPPAVLMDFNQGWLNVNQGEIARFLKERPYVARTHDLRKPAWVEVRKKGIHHGVWFSPIQDMAEGGLWFAGNWEDIRKRLVEYLQADKTLWSKGKWLHHIVIQISYDGALVLGPGTDTEGELLIFAGDLPGSFSQKGYGAVVAGGIVFVASLVQTLLTKTPAESTTVLQCAREGLARTRIVVEEGYVGPNIEATDWKLSKPTNLPISSLEHPKTDEIITYPVKPPEADWQAACDIVFGDDDMLRRRAFKLGNLISASPDYARTLLRLASRLETHVRQGTGILSFAIFGAPGSGKSFVAEQLSNVADSTGKTLKQLLFNVSQLGDPSRLVDALEQIQTTSLQGKIPFVLWDEFDTSLQGNQAGWLPYFLMPMEDAKFFDGMAERSLGKSIFVFIGGTFKDADDLKKWALDTSEGKRLKGPDFHSRLDSYLTVPSLDLTVSLEEAFTKSDMAKLNRAVFIRSLLRKQEKVKSIAQDVLAYLLHVPLVHSGRSLQRIIIASDLRRTSIFQAFHLPPADVLQLHVEGPVTTVKDPVLEFLKKIKCEELRHEPPLPLKWR